METEGQVCCMKWEEREIKPERLGSEANRGGNAGGGWGGNEEGGGTRAEAEEGGAEESLERVSATTFSVPGIWTMKLVNSAR